MKKNLLSNLTKSTLILTATAIATATLPSYTYSQNTFSDINNVPWASASETIQNVASLGLINGYEDNTYRAFNNVTYLEALQMVYTILLVTGNANSLTSDIISNYSSYMTGFNIPSWSQQAVTYALHYKLIDLEDLNKFMSGSYSNNATREDVATIFANSINFRYKVTTSTSEAQKFKDYSDIDPLYARFIDLVTRMGIIQGDNNGYFNPKNLINRAEMATIIERTYNLLKEGVSKTGTITNISQSSGLYDIEITFSDNTSTKYYATSTSVEVTTGSEEEKESTTLSRLMVNDKVTVGLLGDILTSIHVDTISNPQERFNITGYLSSYSGDTIKIINENTEETESYYLNSSMDIFINGERIEYKDLAYEVNVNSKLYGYCGLYVSVNSTPSKDVNGNYFLEQETLINELHIDFGEDYEQIGRITSIENNRITFTSMNNSNSSTYAITGNTSLSIDGKSASQTEIENLLSSGTLYVTATLTGINSSLSAIDVTTTAFEYSSDLENKTYTLSTLTTSQLKINNNGDAYIYSFNETNPFDNFNLYWWTESSTTSQYSWKSMSIADIKAEFEKVYDDDLNADIYVKLKYNSGGKITRIEFSNKVSAWTLDTSYGKSETRQGTVTGISNNMLYFKDVTRTYEMLSTYNIKVTSLDNPIYVTGDDPNNYGGFVRNPLSIKSTRVSSLTLFENLANDPDVELYAEILADENNKVQSVDSKLLSAVGYLSYVDFSNNQIQIVTEADNTIDLYIKSRPTLSDNISSRSDLETSMYKNSIVSLGFSSNGEEVDEVTLLVDGGFVSGNRVAGEFTGTGNGFTLVSTGDTFTWGSRTSVMIDNISSTSTTTYGLDTLLQDKYVTIYGDAILNSYNGVSSISLKALSAVGSYQGYNTGTRTITLRTNDFNTFTFFASSNITFDIDVDDIGATVELIFTDGLVTRVVG